MGKLDVIGLTEQFINRLGAHLLPIAEESIYRAKVVRCGKTTRNNVQCDDH